VLGGDRDNRLRAKIATGFAKPEGIYRLTKHNWVEVMGDRPPDALWGVGSKTAAKLKDMGITTVVGLARADPEALAARFGPTMGPWYRMLAFGVGGTEVTAAPYVRKSRSREVTFQRNLTARADLDAEVRTLARRVADDVVEEGRPAVRVAVKVRFAPFFTHTRSVPLPDTDQRRRGHRARRPPGPRALLPHPPGPPPRRPRRLPRGLTRLNPAAISSTPMFPAATATTRSYTSSLEAPVHSDAVDLQKHRRSHPAEPLVAVDQRVVLHDRLQQSGRLGPHIGIGVLTEDGRRGPGGGGAEQAEVADGRGVASR
jgi:hypothetical protein